jgi:hypothetical protein
VAAHRCLWTKLKKRKRPCVSECCLDTALTSLSSFCARKCGANAQVLHIHGLDMCRVVQLEHHGTDHILPWRSTESIKKCLSCGDMTCPSQVKLLITNNSFCTVQKATAQSKQDFFCDYGVAEVPPGFQAGWSDCMFYSLFLFFFFGHLEFPCKFLYSRVMPKRW